MTELLLGFSCVPLGLPSDGIALWEQFKELQTQEDRTECWLQTSRVFIRDCLKSHKISCLLRIPLWAAGWVFSIDQMKADWRISNTNPCSLFWACLVTQSVWTLTKKGSRSREPQGGADISCLILAVFDSFGGCLLSALAKSELFC